MALKGLDFARAMLEKYGWKEGKGLGRNEDGMAQALKPKCKFDKAGVGHSELSDQFTSQWWEKAYNKVAKNISVIQDEGDIQIQQENREELFKTKDARPFSMYNPTDYNAFVKTHVLTGEGEVKVAEPISNPGTSEKDAPVGGGSHLTDEEIFEACGGRTVHKGARHGLNLNGKLARIQRQEQELILQYQSSQPSSEASGFKQSENKKKKKSKMDSIFEGTTIGIESECVLTFEKSKKKIDCLNTSDDSLKASKRKKIKNNIETEFAENSPTINISVNYTCSSFLIDNTDPQYKMSKKKGKKESEEEVEDVKSSITDTSTAGLRKKKKKKLQNDDAQLSEIINSSPSDCKKAKRKKNTLYEGSLD